MAVLHLISDTARRGAQVFAVQLAAELERVGVTGRVAALEEADTDASLSVTVLDRGRRSRRAEMRHYDLVIAHGSTTLDAAAVTVPKRFVYRSIGDPTFWLSSPARRAKTGALMHTTKAVVALYPDARTALMRLTRLSDSRVHVIPNAVAPASADDVQECDWPNLTAAARHVLYVGALSWEKQVHHLIEAIGLVPEAGLVIVGDGPERERLQELGARRLGDRVLFAGAVDNPGPYYERCDILGLASKTEGMPGCVLEAAQAGTATCAYDVGGVGAMIEDGRSGRVVPKDVVPALAEALEWALPRASELGEAAATLAKARFSMTAVAGSWAQLIASLKGDG